MRLLNNHVLIGGFALCLAGCATVQTDEDVTSPVLPVSAEIAAYADSVADAKRVEKSEISRELTPVFVENPDLIWKTIDGERHVLVTTWTDGPQFYLKTSGTQLYNPGSYTVWVTLVPELRAQCRQPGFEGEIGLSNRLKRLIGLPPSSAYYSFVELWVKPEDLIRPCPDPEISDTQCDLSFPPEVSDAHRDWIENERKTTTYPWTQLGYTYDWYEGGDDEVGLSEFIIRRNADMKIAGIYPTETYCARD